MAFRAYSWIEDLEGAGFRKRKANKIKYLQNGLTHVTILVNDDFKAGNEVNAAWLYFFDLPRWLKQAIGLKQAYCVIDLVKVVITT